MTFFLVINFSGSSITANLYPRAGTKARFELRTISIVMSGRGFLFAHSTNKMCAMPEVLEGAKKQEDE